MAFETIVTGKILNNKGLPQPGITVNLKAIRSKDNITGYRDTHTLFYDTSNGGGFVQFSGVTAGFYDIQMVSGATTWNLYDYQVKNSFVVVPGGSEFVEENRTFIRSLDTLAPSGIMSSIQPRPNNKLGVPNKEYPELSYDTGSITTVYTNPFNESETFSAVTQKNREYSDDYFRGNQNLKHVQNFTFKLS